jgi:putative phosphoesterase
MLIAVVSDTHGHVGNTLAAIRMLEEFAPSAVFHCGDIGTPEIPPLFAAWPTYFVFGNCDAPAELRPALASSRLINWERFGQIELGNRKIAMLHSDDARRFHQVTHSDEFDLVCYGHTHVKKIERIGKSLVLNPGALYRATPKTFALVELDDLTVTHLAIE